MFRAGRMGRTFPRRAWRKDGCAAEGRARPRGTRRFAGHGAGGRQRQLCGEGHGDPAEGVCEAGIREYWLVDARNGGAGFDILRLTRAGVCGRAEAGGVAAFGLFGWGWFRRRSERARMGFRSLRWRCGGIRRRWTPDHVRARGPGPGREQFAVRQSPIKPASGVVLDIDASPAKTFGNRTIAVFIQVKANRSSHRRSFAAVSAGGATGGTWLLALQRTVRPRGCRHRSVLGSRSSRPAPRGYRRE